MATRKFTVTYHDNGDIIWHDESLRLSRRDGPAVEWADGAKSWFVDGELHRLDGPAIERAVGDKMWWIDDKPLSEEEFHAEVKRRQTPCAGLTVDVDGVNEAV